MWHAIINILILFFFSRYKLPFDRHDWVVDRCGEQVRYVIDFYAGSPIPGKPASFYLDVRPALDSFVSFKDRFLYWWRGMD